MNDVEIHQFARTLAEIAHALEHVDDVSARISRVLALTRDVIPYARITLLDVDDARHHLFSVPPADLHESASITTSLMRAWRNLSHDDGGAPDPSARLTSLTLPAMGLDRVNGILRVEPPDHLVYEVTHLRLLSVIAAQLGAYMTMTRLREEQARHTAELATAIEFQQVLAAVVGHDLRSPLAVITTVASMLRDTTTDPFQLRALDRALTSAQRASRLISDLIDVTECRVQGAMPIRKVRSDARRIVEDCVEEARIAHPTCTIELAFESNEVVFGHWDPDRIAEVLTNLINNAAFHGATGCPVHVTMSHDHDTLRLAVRNSGPPIPERLLPTIFDPFKRGAGVRASGKRGLGLGLYIVAQIIASHGGTVTVTSTTEDGTTFSISLPREGAAPVAVDPPTGQLVLVVDDDPEVRIGVVALLEKRGFAVAHAVDGLDAYEQLQRGLRPSAILLDLHMPRMDGEELCRLCGEDPQLAAIPIVIVSSDTATAVKLSRVGAVLPKPVRGTDLLRALDRINLSEPA